MKKKTGKKFDNNKPDLTLLPYEVLEECAYVLMFGAARYGRYNWEEGLDYTRVAGAAQRHLGKFMDKRQSIDYDRKCVGCKKKKCKIHSNRHHLAASIVSLMFLLSYELNKRTELDNRRPKK